MSSSPVSDPELLPAIVATAEDVAALRRLAGSARARPLVDFSRLEPPFPRERFPPRRTAEGREPFRLEP